MYCTIRFRKPGEFPSYPEYSVSVQQVGWGMCHANCTAELQGWSYRWCARFFTVCTDPSIGTADTMAQRTSGLHYLYTNLVWSLSCAAFVSIPFLVLNMVGNQGLPYDMKTKKKNYKVHVWSGRRTCLRTIISDTYCPFNVPSLK